MSEEEADGLGQSKGGFGKILFLAFNVLLFLAGAGFFVLTKMGVLVPPPSHNAQAAMQPSAESHPPAGHPCAPLEPGAKQPCTPLQPVQLNAKAPASAASAKPLLIQMKPFVVNLSGSRGRRYLRIALELEVLGEQGKTSLESHTSQVRNRLLFLLSNQTIEDINTTEGKYRLQEDITQQINETIGVALVTRTYFTDFIVQ